MFRLPWTAQGHRERAGTDRISLGPVGQKESRVVPALTLPQSLQLQGLVRGQRPSSLPNRPTTAHPGRRRYGPAAPAPRPQPPTPGRHRGYLAPTSSTHSPLAAHRAVGKSSNLPGGPGASRPPPPVSALPAPHAMPAILAPLASPWSAPVCPHHLAIPASLESLS